jgi:hypothetical protein
MRRISLLFRDKPGGMSHTDLSADLSSELRKIRPPLNRLRSMLPGMLLNFKEEKTTRISIY